MWRAKRVFLGLCRYICVKGLFSRAPLQFLFGFVIGFGKEGEELLGT